MLAASTSPGPYRIAPWSTRDAGLPLVVDAAGTTALDTLTAWLRERADWVTDRLTEHGALLFRGFRVHTPLAFEAVARAISPDLGNHYLGTPANRLTEYVFPASDAPGLYAIAQHCEMSYLVTPPERLFFSCLVAPTAGGETPLVDFRTVARELDHRVRERFERGGIRVVRTFRGARHRGGPWSLPRWDRFFGTTDRAGIAARCRADGIDLEWHADDRITLRFSQPLFRTHPRSHESIWYNQLVADHVDTPPADYRRIFQLRPTMRHWLGWQLVRAITAVKKHFPPTRRPFDCTYADGSPIPRADLDAVRDVIWRHMVIVPWHEGDVLAIDNRAVGHGRLPFRGPRQVLACLAGGRPA
jgi:alpha-ketoglutarate-dependent taurine dioxygenase